ncbi:FMN-linked oxidoreductase [Cytidiella melzeri]|nr:FMN-linked oxidoreductase [Cytidiella melzeri]
MVEFNTIDINPPLLNSSCLWASDLTQLRELYECPYTGAVTTRTATLNGFSEDNTHTVAFSASSTTSLNSYGYSPHPLRSYISWVYDLLTHPTTSGSWPAKPIIISITSSSSTVLQEMVDEVMELRFRLHDFHMSRDPPAVGVVNPMLLVAIELNTSCPNIRDTTPPAYNLPFLVPFLDVLASAYYSDPSVTIGLKLPPYIYSARFQDIVRRLSSYSRPNPRLDGEDAVSPFAFVTCTNTLGSCLLLTDQLGNEESATNDTPFALPTHLGGLGGEALHPLALGNVYAFSRLFAEHRDPGIRKIKVIGVGGVTSLEARQRMIHAGASAVACATLLGQRGVKAFELLTNGQISA